MPSSTIWRRSASDPATRGISPARPSAEFIERISPEPPLPFAFPEPAPSDTGYYPHNSFLNGLGLSQTEPLDGASTFAHPDHLYIDHNGGAHVKSKVVSTGGKHDRHQSTSSHDWNSWQSRLNHESRRAQGKGHTRSGSTIDDLASAAIATSPTFTNGSPQSYTFNGSPINYNPIRPSTSYVGHENHRDNDHGPPAKRVKSERLPAVEWSPQRERPTTSYQASVESISEEVALLLGLRNEINFKTHASPPAPRPPQVHHTSHAFPHTPSDHGMPAVSRWRDLSENQATQTTQSHGEATSEYVTQKIERDEPFATSTFVTEKPIPPFQEPQNAGMEGKTIPPAEALDKEAPPEPTAEDDKYVAATQPKKPRRVKPQVQAEVCAGCERLQRETEDDDATISWICCNGCNRWFHAMCAGFKSKSEARSVDKFVCKDCESQHGSTTFVRKSSRARTAIDYAGLNQGVVKSSVDTSMHHYVQPIKDGRFTFLPDDFARIRPELLTTEFMESFDNMKRPFVVPACWNPRFGGPKPAESPVEVEPSFEKARYDGNGTIVGPDPEDIDDESSEKVIDCDQDLLDMVMPRDLTVRKVAELYGPDEPVPVIDVKTQETKGTYTLKQWAEYYEQPGEKPIRNVISLEVSLSPLGRLIRRPKVVRELDLEDHVWDAETRAGNKKRPVQFYCLMSVADSYTDFHIDFGGSSVYYHILKGTKTFFFIPPEDKYLKKYEDWCNSDTQNESFLGELCHNNCTRVDLHEGDTAFIPAGWIHAVWTPEDSLVIGGNFLTRIDYELQLKVVNIEKLTKVAASFRYPFFQKVMWYTLIKYLEDDPVPDEVLQDFNDDPDNVFLRANPIWHEIGDLASNAEPGLGEYNSRYYPKSEVSGFPALRDYLYRTARVYADLPVPDINKKGIDAVKASVPKGHGDPLLMIKKFAIWCAWKIGNVPVPEWVHADAGGLPELEQKEKAKKLEVFRLPGERTSLRKASQAMIRDSPDPALVTPSKQVNNVAEADHDSAMKSRSGSKVSALRVACDACRKRRIKCRHKEGEASPSTSEQSVRPRSYSVVSTDAPTPLEPLPWEHGGLPLHDSVPQEANLTSDLAQAALATLDSQPAHPSQGTVISTLASSGKKSRSKACEECRKSKRRCVHDEHGRVDAAKAAEPSKPRGSSNAKRPARMSDENMQTKRTKIEGDADELPFLPQYSSIDAMIDPALTNGAFTQYQTENAEVDMHLDMPNDVDADAHLERPDIMSDVPAAMGNGNMPRAPLDASTFPLDPALLMDATTAIDVAGMKSEPDPATSTTVPEMQSPTETYVRASTPEQSRTEEFGHSPTKPMTNGDVLLNGVSPSSRHSSRQPKQIERYIPQGTQSLSRSQPRPIENERRGSSAVSGQSVITSVKSRRSSSNTSGTTHQIAAMVGKRAGSREISMRPVSRGSTAASSEVDADEKFARELQAAENGLRRRQSVRM